MHIETHIESSHEGEKSTRKQRAELWTRRQKNLVDCQGSYFFVNSDNEPFRFRCVVNPKRFVQYSGPLSESREALVQHGSTSTDRRQHFFATVGVPNYGGFLDGYFNASDNRRLIEIVLESPSIRYLRAETVGGDACDVVGTETPYGRVTFWLASNRGHSVRKMEYHKKAGDLLASGRPMSMPRQEADENEPRLDTFSMILEEVEVKNLEGAWVAVGGKLTQVDRYSDGAEYLDVFTCTRDRIELTPAFDGTDAFKIDLANGATIANWDEPKSSGLRHIWRDGDVVLAHADYSADLETHIKLTSSVSRLIASVGGVILLVIAAILLRKRSAN